MANEKHVAKLEDGVEAWNAWRRENENMTPDLQGANLVKSNLSKVNLAEALLTKARLHEANLTGANLREADLSESDLRETCLRETDLTGARLTGARLDGANLYQACLYGAHFDQADLLDTFFIDVDLAKAKGLEGCYHFGPSPIDHRTLQKSGPLPKVFLRGCGLPEIYIDNISALFLNSPIEFYSCFISYSSQDQAFAQRLHADLQDKGVRCWFAPHDLPIGARIRDTIDQSICKALSFLDTFWVVSPPLRRMRRPFCPDALAPGFYSRGAGGSTADCIAA